MSACRVRALGFGRDSLTEQLARVFRVAGRHEVVIDALSGGCTGALRRIRRTIVVDVAAASALHLERRADARPGGGAQRLVAAAAASCRDSSLVPTTAASRARVAAAILCLVNVERRKRGRTRLLRSPRLARAAAAHSSDMQRRRYFEHERVPGGPKLAARLRRAGYRGPTYAENIGYGSDFNAALMVDAWMHSPGHRANILHPRLRFGGVGLATAMPLAPQRPGSTYTMDFGATPR
jgi:uncharacterized protein YkwD